MAQKFTEIRVPFTNMSFTPDVPSTALSAQEYNAGRNVETDVRGIRSVFGDQTILPTVPGTATFITGGYRGDNKFWFVVATTEGYWYASNGGAWQNINPDPAVPFTGYTTATNITESWNGTVVFFNDSLNAPMFLPTDITASLVVYSNEVKPLSIASIAYLSPTTQRITLTDTQATPPYVAGNQILIQGVDQFYNGTFTVVTSTTTTIDYVAVPGSAYPGGPLGTVTPLYTWNYNPNWQSYYANFMRLYNTPNVGSILVAGNLTATPVSDPSITEVYPVTVQWSQSFGLNQAPTTWQPTITNIANQLEVPLRGPALDAFPANGSFFLCSYWDTVVFSPLNYSTTSAPILGVRLYNQGRGLLSSNCWANTDQTVFGIDARDIWMFDGQNFTGIGNQRVRNYFFDNLNPDFVDRVFMETNTYKSQIEIYFPDKTQNNGTCNQMISYRYDLSVWNAPRDVTNATFSCESPIWSQSGNTWQNNEGSRTVVYAQGVANVHIAQKDQGFHFITSSGNSTPIQSIFHRDNIKLLPDYSGHLLVHRVLPEVVNLDKQGLPVSPASTGNLTVQVSGSNSVGSEPQQLLAVTIPIDTDNPWAQINQNAYRVNALDLSNTSDANNSVWICSATTWQYTQTQDDR